MEPIPLSLHQIPLRVMRLSVRVLDPGLSIKSLASLRLNDPSWIWAICNRIDDEVGDLLVDVGREYGRYWKTSLSWPV